VVRRRPVAGALVHLTGDTVAVSRAQNPADLLALSTSDDRGTSTDVNGACADEIYISTCDSPLLM
jgi:hypothetical protein